MTTALKNRSNLMAVQFCCHRLTRWKSVDAGLSAISKQACVEMVLDPGVTMSESAPTAPASKSMPLVPPPELAITVMLLAILPFGPTNKPPVSLSSETALNVFTGKVR